MTQEDKDAIIVDLLGQVRSLTAELERYRADATATQTRREAHRLRTAAKRAQTRAPSTHAKSC